MGPEFEVLKSVKNPPSHRHFTSVLRLILRMMGTALTVGALSNTALAQPQVSDEGMQVQMHETKGRKKKLPKVVRRDATPLPSFTSAFAPTPTPKFQPIEDTPSPAKPAPVPTREFVRQPTPSVQPSVPQARESFTPSEVAHAPVTESLNATKSGESWSIRPMGWLDYSAVGVFTTPNISAPTAGTTSTTTQTHVLDQIFTAGAGLDAGSDFHLSVDGHFQYESQLETSTESTTPTSTTQSTDSVTVNDIYAHGIYRDDLTSLFGAGESLKFDFGALAPMSQEAKDEGYQAVYLGSAMLSSRLVPGFLTLQNTISANYIWNRDQYSTVSGLAHQEGGAGYRLGLAVRLAKNLEWTGSGGVKASPSFDGSVATHFNAATTVADKIGSWLFHLGYSRGTYQEFSGQNLWYIDQPQQVVSAGLGVRF